MKHKLILSIICMVFPLYACGEVSEKNVPATTLQPATVTATPRSTLLPVI